ncbi:ATP-binding domain-containing protein [Actinokineospora sp. UTMC 2448]|uniref:ATP-binding domain-containing protein n=1 Tax=Actinokineospora sp. UTMC 2448 TaxID=2268449 RepID=UPI0021648714|nr:ATP-binding domain-containing protein [Actinokineospora sp. UTMC 2448]
MLRQMERGGGASATLAQLSRNRGIGQAVRAIWPAVDPARLVFDLLTDAEQLAAAADGILSADEQRAVLLSSRPRGVKSMRWSTVDLAMLDEVAGLVATPARMGHIVVDEAQDLSPLHFRAIARRVAGACTVLGDLAQATSPFAVRDWSEVLTHLDRPKGAVEVLSRGYRVPAEIIDYAARLLPSIAPDLTGPQSFRHTEGALHVTRTPASDQLDLLITTLEDALRREGSVGVIAADKDIPTLQAALSTHGLSHTVLGEEDTPERLTLAPVTLTKGLEYDTVVVIEPTHIVDAEPRGLQRLYVALTRAVSTLHVIHSEDLPSALTPELALAG